MWGSLFVAILEFQKPIALPLLFISYEIGKLGSWVIIINTGV